MHSVLIIGGYGAVGRHIANGLAHYPNSALVLAGRDLAKAQAAAKPIGATARRVDVADPATWEAALDGITMVIMCIDQTSTDLVALIAARAIAYLDITADDGLFRQIEAIPATAPMLLSVGLAPGLSNMLAIAAARSLDSVERIEIGLLMGLDDEHGKAAVDWTIADVFAPGVTRDIAKMDYGPDFGPRRSYSMDFSDQHALNRTMPGVNTVSRVTFDSAIMTRLLFWMGRTFSGNHFAERLVVAVSKIPTGGSDKCVLIVSAFGTKNGKAHRADAAFYGNKEGLVTAQIAANMAKSVLDGAVPGGVWHSHQVIATDALFSALEGQGNGRFDLTQLNQRRATLPPQS